LANAGDTPSFLDLTFDQLKERVVYIFKLIISINI